VRACIPDPVHTAMEKDMPVQDHCFLDATELARQIAVIDAHLRRIDAIDPFFPTWHSI
jgi:hypothetical protein